jgi:hypothetical protein
VILALSKCPPEKVVLPNSPAILPHGCRVIQPNLAEQQTGEFAAF